MGIFKLLHDILYRDPCQSNRGRFYNSVYQRDEETAESQKLLWAVQRPGEDFKSDIHWFAPADEVTHEFLMRVLWNGGFYSTLQSIGEHFEDLESLTIQSIGFLAVSHAVNEGIHHDFEHVQGKAFNLLIPILLPHNTEEPELKLVGHNATMDYIHTLVKYENNVGVMVGDETHHGTRDCDHTATQEMRDMLSVYLVDLTEDNVEKISADKTALFPVPEDVEWLWSQRARHWHRNSLNIIKWN